ncbi:hypothetical protein AB0C84_45385 [Actinomadura sp. NPDC048955]|uniref:hypothetical protein n=1 Tax=Actinomadura sp. NPDC048955 TaxID=3158228 RepID=UPI0033F0205B
MSVERLYLENGSVVIRKVMTEDRFADAEELVSIFGQRIDAPVPIVLRTDARELYMELMPGRPAGLVLPGLSAEAAAPYVRTVGGLLLGVIDAATANDDRHEFNWQISDGGLVWGIDHASVDVEDGVENDDGIMLPGAGSSSSPFAEHWLVRNSSWEETWKTNALHPLDAERLIKQAISMQGEFQARGYDHWWLVIVKRLEAIEEYAKGETPWLKPRQAARPTILGECNSRSSKSTDHSARPSK